MRLTRRAVLGTGSLVLAGSLAGCSRTPSEYASLGVTLRGEFDSEPPVAVPVDVEIAVQNVDAKGVGVEGVTLGLYDRQFERFGYRELSEFSWRGADSSQRETEERGGTFTSTTVYRASWEQELTVEATAVPAWITFSIERLWIDDDDAEQSGIAPVGVARASQPVPDLTVRLLEYADDGPPRLTVEPGDYRQRQFVGHRPTSEHEDGALFPSGTFSEAGVESIELTLRDETVAVGDRTVADVTAGFTDGSSEQVNQHADIQSLNESVATADGSELTGRRPGTATIEARFRTETARTELQVDNDTQSS